MSTYRRLKRQFRTIDGPAHYAAYLINGDTVGAYSAREISEIKQWLVEEDLSASDCVECSEESYIGRFDFPQQGTLQCDMYTYTFLQGESV